MWVWHKGDIKWDRFFFIDAGPSSVESPSLTVVFDFVETIKPKDQFGPLCPIGYAITKEKMNFDLQRRVARINKDINLAFERVTFRKVIHQINSKYPSVISSDYPFLFFFQKWGRRVHFPLPAAPDMMTIDFYFSFFLKICQIIVLDNFTSRICLIRNTHDFIPCFFLWLFNWSTHYSTTL